MKLFDVNVLVNAFREDAPDHELFHRVLDEAVNGFAPFGLSPLALSGFLRIVTNPRVFKMPSTVETALEFCEDLLSRPQCRRIEPGSRHWSIFRDLCLRLRAEGNLVPDIWFAALAVESGCTWVSGDRDYGLIPDFDWQFIHR